MTWLSTERLTLHRWTGADRNDLAALAALPEVVRHVGDGTPWSAELVSGKHDAALAHWAEHGFGRLAVRDRAGAFVGLVSANRRTAEESHVDGPAVEIGYWVAPSAWGRGYATEMTSAVVAELFARDRADRLMARHFAANTVSGRLLDKLGFTRHHVVDGLVWSVLDRPARAATP
ncbi:GNAT family N-acetyltransferase [Saccharothrix violaceirubra]|uniref:RimJ/RimL family protein N-acetyltransferase n=1 Tax=Saccharothrix violaceirubra TaxID=413306 RepID=A0A7W7T4Z1_9PSEU|nr:GNAT family N-acetyltransferase [Saccharothrix violaceirubra]MBB4966102.1 RimJ/RimL family protein N-acetyltransferase [Saccharothrix violaceirubra]